MVGITNMSNKKANVLNDLFKIVREFEKSDNIIDEEKYIECPCCNGYKKYNNEECKICDEYGLIQLKNLKDIGLNINMLN